MKLTLHEVVLDSNEWEQVETIEMGDFVIATRDETTVSGIVTWAAEGDKSFRFEVKHFPSHVIYISDWKVRVWRHKPEPEVGEWGVATVRGRRGVYIVRTIGPGGNAEWSTLVPVLSRTRHDATVVSNYIRKGKVGEES